MKAIFGEVFSKISNGILIGCLGTILVSWGLYETSDTMMLVGIIILCVGFMLAVTSETRTIKAKNKSNDKIEKLETKVKFQKKQIEELQDAVMYLSQDMKEVSEELKSKTATVEKFKKIRLSAIKNSKVWEDCEGLE